MSGRDGLCIGMNALPEADNLRARSGTLQQSGIGPIPEGWFQLVSERSEQLLGINRVSDDKAARSRIVCADLVQLWVMCLKKPLDGNPRRQSKPVLEPLQDIHFLVQDGDDDGAVDSEPEDVVTLAVMDADLVRQLWQWYWRRSSVPDGVEAFSEQIQVLVRLFGSPGFRGVTPNTPKGFFRGKRKLVARHGSG